MLVCTSYVFDRTEFQFRLKISQKTLLHVQDDIKIGLGETGRDSVDGIYLVQDRGRRWLL
jgi:hypothetical protein